MIKLILKSIILLLIQLIEYFEYKKLDESNKVVKSFKIPDGYEIETDSGFKPISHIHQTKRFQKYRIETESGKWLECADEHILFNEEMKEVFVKDLSVGSLIRTKDGFEKIVTLQIFSSKVGMFDITVDDNDHRFYSNGILSHNSVMTAIVLLHYIFFNTEKNVLMLANKSKTVEEILEKIKQIYLKIPFFMKPGISKWNEGDLNFDNSCKIITAATTTDAGIGFSIDFLYADEFAKIPKNIVEPFWTSIYPTLSSLENSRCILTSTADGYNLFYRIYNGSLKGINEFGNMVTYWYEVEGRDEAWKQKQIQNLAISEEVFNREFGCQFTSNESLLLDSKTLEFLKGRELKYVHKVFDSFEEAEIKYDKLIWNSDFYDEIFSDDGDLENRRFLLSVDLSHGVGLDSSVINVFEIVNMTKEEIFNIKIAKDERDFLKLRQIAIFKANDQPISDIAKICMELVRILGTESVLINFEVNQSGDYFYRELEDDDDFYTDLIIHTKHRMDSNNEKPGVKVTRGNKTNFCKDSKQLIRKGIIDLYEYETINEFKTFGLNKKGSYSAESGHDDIVMSVVNLVPALKSFSYSELSGDIFEKYDKELLDLIYQKIGDNENSEYVDYSQAFNNPSKDKSLMEELGLSSIIN